MLRFYVGKRIAGKSAFDELIDMLNELTEDIEEEQVRKEPETHSKTESTKAKTTETAKTEAPKTETTKEDLSMWAKRAQQLNVKCNALNKELAEKNRQIEMLKADLEKFKEANKKMADKLDKVERLMTTYMGL